MYTNRVRFTLVGLAFTVSVIAFARGEWPIALLFLTAALLMVGSYFRNGTLWLASRAYRRQDPDKAERLLAQIKAPHRLQRRARPYYYFLKGILTFRHGRHDEAEPHLTQALALGLLSPGSACMSHCMLAIIQASRGNYPEARQHLESARALPHPPEVDKMIASTEEKIAAASG
jgi:tetratricopeptide (TPR) repeat protein